MQEGIQFQRQVDEQDAKRAGRKKPFGIPLAMAGDKARRRRRRTRPRGQNRSAAGSRRERNKVLRSNAPARRSSRPADTTDEQFDEHQDQDDGQDVQHDQAVEADKASNSSHPQKASHNRVSIGHFSGA